MNNLGRGNIVAEHAHRFRHEHNTASARNISPGLLRPSGPGRLEAQLSHIESLWQWRAAADQTGDRRTRQLPQSAPGLVTDWTSDSELAKPHALDGRQPGRYAGHEQRVGGPHRVQFGSPTSTRKPSSEPRTAVSTRRARRTQAFALKFPST